MQSQLDLRMGQIVQSFYSSLLIAPDYGMHATLEKDGSRSNTLHEEGCDPPSDAKPTTGSDLQIFSDLRLSACHKG